MPFETTRWSLVLAAAGNDSQAWKSAALSGIPGYVSPSIVKVAGEDHDQPIGEQYAQAAVAWPISRWVRCLPVVPLVIGTLIPDAGYLIDLAPGRSFGHWIFGAMTVGLALILVLWWLYEAWVKPTLLRGERAIVPLT